MGSFGNLLILVTYIVEVSLLIYLEVKTWKTLYTPFSFLVLPYTVVLLISISVAGNFNFVEFYYPSILIWCGGMLLFAIPSLTLGALLAFYGKPVNGQVDKGSFPKSILFFIGLVILLFIYHFRQILGGTTFFVGSDDFANDFSGYGFWAHLRLISLPILIMAIYYLDKKHWWLCLVVVPVLLINFLNQVKGWVIIPVISGLALRLYSGKMKLNLLFLCYTTLGAFFECTVQLPCGLRHCEFGPFGHGEHGLEQQPEPGRELPLAHGGRFHFHSACVEYERQLCEL